MTMYLVRVYRDERGGLGYCADDNYYCAGLYSNQNAAERRAYIFGAAADVIEIEIDTDIRVDLTTPNTPSWDHGPCGDLWLGGARYCE